MGDIIITDNDKDIHNNKDKMPKGPDAAKRSNE